MKFCIDASSFIHLWNEVYPQKTFPSLYPQLENGSGRIALIKPIWDELKEEDDLIAWLKKTGLEPLPLSQSHKEEAFKLGEEYKISPSSTGASQTDIDLISFAKREGHIVVTQEEHQPNKPSTLSKYKIPLICQEEDVPCMNFLEFLQENNIVV